MILQVSSNSYKNASKTERNEQYIENAQSYKTLAFLSIKRKNQLKSYVKHS